MVDFPAYDKLPIQPALPPGSSWGVWGAEDALGTLNLLTDAATLSAAASIRRGRVFPLSLPLDEPDPHPGWREGPAHHILRVGHEGRAHEPGGSDDASAGACDRDDYLDGFWLQGSTQWDGLAHVRHPEWGNYNGVPDESIHAGPGGRLGIDRWAERAVVGRGIVVDVGRHRQATGRPIDLRRDDTVSVDDLRSTVDAQGSPVRSGDVLLVRTGWLGAYRSSSAEERSTMMGPVATAVPGLESGEEMAAFLWDLHVAAVASDTMAVEATTPALDFPLHRRLLPLLGMPLGELWVLDELAEDCADDGRYDVFLASVPLNLRGAIGSPAQAVAIK